MLVVQLVLQYACNGEIKMDTGSLSVSTKTEQDCPAHVGCVVLTKDEFVKLLNESGGGSSGSDENGGISINMDLEDVPVSGTFASCAVAEEKSQCDTLCKVSCTFKNESLTISLKLIMDQIAFGGKGTMD